MDGSVTNQFSHADPGPTRGNEAEGAPIQSPSGTLVISETFSSRQGEGKLTGVESFFIRTSGCNLRCHFCDTPYASWQPKGTPLTIDHVVELATQSGLQHVVLTGGEPLLPQEISELSARLRSASFHVTIETAGTIDRDIPCDLMSISPKLSSSTPAADQHPRWNQLHESRRMPIEVMQSLIERSDDWQLKFVVSAEQDYPEITEVVEQLGVTPKDVWLMPEGVTIEKMDEAKSWLEPWCLKNGFQFCDRMQIRWFGNRRGT